MQPTFTVPDVLERLAEDKVFRRELIERAKQCPQVCELLLQETAPDLIRALLMLRSRLTDRKDGK